MPKKSLSFKSFKNPSKLKSFSKRKEKLIPVPDFLSVAKQQLRNKLRPSTIASGKRVSKAFKRTLETGGQRFPTGEEFKKLRSKKL